MLFFPFASLSTLLVGQPGGSFFLRLRSVICSFSSSYFHFNPLFTAGTKALCIQMSKSWLFLEQAMGRRRGGWGGRQREIKRGGHQRQKNERLCEEAKQQLLTGETVEFKTLISTLYKCTKENEMFFAGHNTLQNKKQNKTKWQENAVYQSNSMSQRILK